MSELHHCKPKTQIHQATLFNSHVGPRRVIETIGKLLGNLGQGDHFGEMAVLSDIPRQATVKTQSSCLLISISRAHFRNLMKLVPDVGESVQAVMRMYMLSKFFHSLMFSNVLKKLVKGFR